MRQGDECAQSTGINVSAYKLWGVGLSSFITGVGGALLAGQVGALNAATFFASDSVVLFAVALLGGAFSLAGAIIAAAAYQLLPAELTQLSITGNASLVIFGLGLLSVLAVAPSGIAGLGPPLVRSVHQALGLADA